MTELNQERSALLAFLWRNRKVLGIVTGVAFVVSVIISLLLTPLYLSTAIVFPTASSNVSFSEQRNVKAGSMDFGEEDQAEQLVQILSSSRIKDKIVSKYNLLNHYEIDEDDASTEISEDSELAPLDDEPTEDAETDAEEASEKPPRLFRGRKLFGKKKARGKGKKPKD